MIFSQIIKDINEHDSLRLRILEKNGGPTYYCGPTQRDQKVGFEWICLERITVTSAQENSF